MNICPIIFVLLGNRGEGCLEIEVKGCFVLLGNRLKSTCAQLTHGPSTASLAWHEIFQSRPQVVHVFTVRYNICLLKPGCIEDL